MNQKWEYKVVCEGPFHAEKVLNGLAAEGWEVLTAEFFQEQDGPRMLGVLLKRAIRPPQGGVTVG